MRLTPLFKNKDKQKTRSFDKMFLTHFDIFFLKENFNFHVHKNVNATFPLKII